MRIGILGGGLAGLACGYYLAREGHEITVFGAAESLGALCLSFRSGGREFPRIPHSLHSTDSALCGLLAELGLSDRLVWKSVRSAVAIGGALQPLGSVRELLRLSRSSPIAQVGRALRWKLSAATPRYAMHLDEVPAGEWVRRFLGVSGYDRLAAPLLRSLYGEYADETPAYLIHARIQRDRPVRGCLRGGYRALWAGLAGSIERAGGRVLLGHPARQVEDEGGGVSVCTDRGEHRFDHLVSSLSLPALAKIAAGGLRRQLPFTGALYQGLVCVAVVCRRRLAPFYQTWIADDGAPFWSIEHQGVFGEEPDGEGEVVYLRRSCPEHSERYRTADKELALQALDTLAKHYPSFSRSDVVDIQVTRRPEVEPRWTLGARKRPPPFWLHGRRVFLCTSAHAYPRRPGADSSVILARETAQRVLQ
jgi:protoporphyrinogen oxidase